MSRALLALLVSVAAEAGVSQVSRPLPREILALYDSKYQKDVRDTRIHRLLEMPLNHLGLVVRYRDVNRGLPPLSEMQDVRGVLTWFQSDAMARPAQFLAWAEGVIDAGKRFVVIGDLSVGRDLQGRMTPTVTINSFLARLGVRAESWTPVTYDFHVLYKDPEMLDFEHPLPAALPPFDRLTPVDSRVRSHLIVRRGNDPASDGSLVVTGPHGGLIANGYTHFASYRQDQLQWYVNPFQFLRVAFATDEIPKLDTTTVSGRRIYYSQIDGDGWRNETELPRYRRDRLSSAEVLLKEAIEPFADLPVTVAPIAGDLDPDWFGTRESREVARRIFAVPWVEAGSHTYSHPLDWETLAATGSGAASRMPPWFDLLNWPPLARALAAWTKPEGEEKRPTLRRGQSRLRSYELYPFRLDQEIGGAIAFLRGFLPAAKRVEVLQWSGTTLESEAALKAVQSAGVRNLNGGDTRFDPEFPSYAWVAPLGRQVGAFHQVYSSASNENTYTNLWNERFFGFRYVTETLRNTESPLRVKPMDLYYHMYSGEKEASLGALLENLAFARSLELAPIPASQYAAIVDGFFSAAIRAAGDRCWRIENRDGLNTIRFDRADDLRVDFRRSAGVIGYRHFQGSLYVALDAAAPAPVIGLRDGGGAKDEKTPFLIQSRWLIFRFRAGFHRFTFEARGFGTGEMEWQVTPAVRYSILVSGPGKSRHTFPAESGPDGRLMFSAGGSALDPVTVEVTTLGGPR